MKIAAEKEEKKLEDSDTLKDMVPADATGNFAKSY